MRQPLPNNRMVLFWIKELHRRRRVSPKLAPETAAQKKSCPIRIALGASFGETRLRSPQHQMPQHFAVITQPGSRRPRFYCERHDQPLLARILPQIIGPVLAYRTRCLPTPAQNQHTESPFGHSNSHHQQHRARRHFTPHGSQHGSQRSSRFSRPHRGGQHGSQHGAGSQHVTGSQHGTGQTGTQQLTTHTGAQRSRPPKQAFAGDG